MAKRTPPARGKQRASASGILDALFAAVYAAPDDDAPRVVLADALQLAGDPRGELIALQLAPPTTASERRIKTLLRKPAAMCAPAIWKLLSVKSVTFERGFIARGRLSAHTKTAWQDATGAVEWATVHTLDLGQFAGTGHLDRRRGREIRRRALSFIHDPAMRHLRRVAIRIDEAAALIEHGVPVPWCDLEISRGYGGHEQRIESLVDGATVFPAVTHLKLEVSVDGLRTLLDRAAWLRRLSKLTLVGECGSLADTVRAWGVMVETALPVVVPRATGSGATQEELDDLFDSQLRGGW